MRVAKDPSVDDVGARHRDVPRLCGPLGGLPSPAAIRFSDASDPLGGYRRSRSSAPATCQDGSGVSCPSAMRRPTLAAVSRSQMCAASCVWTGCHHIASRSGTAS